MWCSIFKGGEDKSSFVWCQTVLDVKIQKKVVCRVVNLVPGVSCVHILLLFCLVNDGSTLRQVNDYPRARNWKRCRHDKTAPHGRRLLDKFKRRVVKWKEGRAVTHTKATHMGTRAKEYTTRRRAQATPLFAFRPAGRINKLACPINIQNAKFNNYDLTGGLYENADIKAGGGILSGWVNSERFAIETFWVCWFSSS